MDYSAQQILFVYKKVKEEKAKMLSGIKFLKPKEAYGNIHMNVTDLFDEHGEDALKFQVVGYGGVVFLGNINGKVPTNGLFYRNANIKDEAERLIRFMHLLEQDKSGAVRYIADQHGSPKPQHAILWQMA